MAESEFKVTYDGPALMDGRMEVRELAPALLALADLFQEAERILNPSAPPVSLDIKATGEGSFIIDLILRVADDSENIFNSDAATALLNLKEYVIGGGFGVFKLVKWIKGRRVQTEILPDGMVRLTLPDGTTLEVPPKALELYGDVTIRRRAREVIQPLGETGIDELIFTSESEVTVSVGASDVDLFTVPRTVPIPLGRNITEMFVSIAAPTFTDNTKWRLSDGNSTFYAAMNDEAFRDRVDRGEAFHKGDRLHCRMEIVQYEDDHGMHLDHTVLEVLAHVTAESIRTQQLQLALEPVDPEPN